jgi:hypothetical protein
MSSSCGISWDRSVIAAVPRRWPLGFGENAKTVILVPKKATTARSRVGPPYDPISPRVIFCWWLVARSNSAKNRTHAL